MFSFPLVRVDDRLIHGQVATKWVKWTKCDKIVIIDNEVSEQKFLSDIFTMAAPPGIIVEIKSVEQAIQEWKDNSIDNKRTLLLFKSITTAKKLWEKGVKINKLQIGGIGVGPGRKVIYQTVSLAEEDVKNLLEMYRNGVEVVFRTIPEERETDFSSILKKHFKELLNS